jgi:hypothetical protein
MSLNQVDGKHPAGEVMRWLPIDTAPEDVPVMTKIDDGAGVRNEQLLKKQGNLWWFADGSMYVYYRPTHWSPR